MENYSLIILSTAMAGYAVLLFRKIVSRTFLRFLIAVFCLLLSVLSCAYCVSDYFTDVGINNAVIFHLKYGLEGAGFGEYKVVVAASLFFIVFSFIGSVLIYQYLALGSSTREMTKKRGYWGGALLITAFIINPASGDIYTTLVPSNSLSDDEIAFDENYVIPEKVLSDSTTKNFVYIYLESFERTYFNEKLFPGLVPGLKSLEKDSLHFTNIQQVANTEWTIAGIVASQCGIPLVTTGQGNSMSNIDVFLPGALCIGDILMDAGYSLNYIGGASLAFAGKGKFFKTHGFSVVRGLNEIKSSLGSDSSLSEWGVYDNDLFRLSHDRFVELSKGEKPFGLFLLTLDTHHPKGHLPKQCKGVTYRDGKNPMLNAVHCSDKMISSFIQDLRDSDHDDDTFIVVGSDHLAFRNTAYDQLQQGRRRNLFLINNPQTLAKKSIDKIGSTLDIGPTLMTILGFDTPSLGFGRDLLGEENTIVEKKQDINGYLKSWTDELMTLWEFPQIDNGLFIDQEKQVVHFGDRSVKYPVLISTDDELIVNKITFGDYTPRKLLEHFEELEGDQPFIWVDTCKNINIASLGNRELRKVSGVCVTAGRLQNKMIYYKRLGNSDHFFLGKRKILDIFSANTGNIE